MAVKEDEVSAEFEDGVLKVTCPKMELAKPNKVTVKIIKKDKRGSKKKSSPSLKSNIPNVAEVKK